MSEYTPVTASRKGLPPATIKSTPRVADPLVVLYNKEGETELVRRDNVRDYIQHHGYTRGASKPTAVDVETEDGEGVGKQKRLSPAPIVEEISDTAKEIIALRERLEAANVKVDSRWGLNRLRAVAADLDVAAGADGQP